MNFGWDLTTFWFGRTKKSYASCRFDLREDQWLCMSVINLCTFRSRKTATWNDFVIPPNSNTFSDWRKTYHVLWVKNSLIPQGANKTHLLPFDSHVIRSCYLKERGKFVSQPESSKRFLRSFFPIIELGATTKQWLVPRETVNFVSPRPQCSLRVSVK